MFLQNSFAPLAFGFSIIVNAYNDEHILGQGLIGSHFGVPGEPHGVPQTFDYVVVGGGTAGLTIAARLAEKNANSVAVIEAGGLYEMDNGNLSSVPAYCTYFIGMSPNDTQPLVDWGIVTTPQAGLDGRVLHYARGKTLGGSSARNLMVYHRGTVGSFQRWADEVGDDSYTFENLLPYFKKSVHFTPPDDRFRPSNVSTTYNMSSFSPSGGPLQVSYPNWASAWSTWVRRGMHAVGIADAIDFSSGVLKGGAIAQDTINPHDESRSSSETSSLRQSIRTGNSLLVFKSSMAKKILFENRKAIGVTVDTAGLLWNIYARKEIIVSAGAFHSPQLLMVSGIGPRSVLENFNIPPISILEGVGQNMWDQPDFGLSHRVNLVTHSQIGNNPVFAAQAIADYNANPPSGILTNTGTDWIGWEKLPSKLRRSQLSSNARNALKWFPNDWPEIEYLTPDAYSGPRLNLIQGAPKDGHNYVTILTTLVAPLSRGNVTIASTDTAVLPVVNPNWLTNPTDIELALAAFKRTRAIFNATALQPILIGPEAWPGPQVQTDAEILASIRGMLATIYHASATCKMGRKSDPMAVVDTKARVFGVEGLRVVDASSFALLPPGHPQSMVYCLAEKIAAEMLARG